MRWLLLLCLLCCKLWIICLFVVATTATSESHLAAGRMAYAAVASLLQTMDYVLRFPCFILEVEKIQIREILIAFQDFSRVSSPMFPVREKTQPLAFQDFVALVGLPVTDESSNNKTPNFLQKMGQIYQELKCMDRDLTKILDIGVRDSSEYVLFRSLILDMQKIKDDLKIVCEFGSKITYLQQELEFLLTNLHDCSNKWDDHGLLKLVKDVAYRTRDFVEESMMNNQIESAMTRYIEEASRIYPTSRALEEAIVLGTGIKNFFEGDNGINSGIRENLVKSSEEIQSIKEQIQANRGKTKNINVEVRSRESSSVSMRDPKKEEIVVGFDDEQLSILEGLTRLPSGLETVTIIGMGGIGKTTLARKLFNEPYTVYHFDCRAWITISQVYQLRDLLLGLLSSVVESSDKISEKSNAELAGDLYRSLKCKRYLIVMDDMWSVDAWNDVKRCFPDDRIGSRIIVTSRSSEVASYVSPKKPPHLMNLLDTEKSWELLEKLVFGISSCPPELVEVGKQIAKRCGGLPLAIVVISGILSRNIKAPDSWKHVAENLSSMVSTDPEQCLDILALSYIYLPHHLKACFLYIGGFPEDCEIEAQKLINLWMAEGFIFSHDPNTLERIAEDYLEELIGRNLVLVEKRSFGGKAKSCRLHDFIRELCLREAQKENFMNVVQRVSSKNFPTGMRNQRRLSFHLDPYSDVPAAPRLSWLSSFLCFTLGSSIIPDILIFELGFKLLRILDIYFLHFEYFPEQIVSLIHLRYLALNVTFELPATISQLRNLQTFIIQGPWSSQESGSSPTLLLEYWSMPSLRHLQTSVPSQLRIPSKVQAYLPRPFAPECLKTLSQIRYSSCRKEIFNIMPNIKRLVICETEEDYTSDSSCDLLNNLVYLQELETLKCCFYAQTIEARRLSCLAAFPSTLRQLSLSSSYLAWEDMATIAKLPKLEVLKLKNYAFQGPKWVPTEVGFPCLKHLFIKKTNLVHWEAAVHQFPGLQKLILMSCKELVEIPFGAEEIGSLQRFEVHYCSERIEILAREIQELVEGIDVVIRSDRAPDSA